MLRFLGIGVVVTLGARRAEACETPTRLSDWRASLSEAEEAWVQLDLEGLRIATDRSATLLVCVDEAVLPGDAARAHRVAGFRADVLGEPDRAAAAFVAARRLDPVWVLPAVLPDGHPLRLLYGREPLEGRVAMQLPRPRSGTLLVDGAETRTRMEGVPAIVQWRAPDGDIRWTGYLREEGGEVGYPVLKAERPAGWVLVGVAGASAVLAAVSYGVAADARDQYYAADTRPSELEALRLRTNTASWVSVGGGVGAAGALIGAVVVFER